MSITDELREAFNDCTVMAGVENDFECVYITKQAALNLLDEIDAAHERELAEQYASLTIDMEPMTDENMAKGGWVRLPLDADGEPIHIGDVMEKMREDLEPSSYHKFKVYGIHYQAYGQGWALSEDGYPRDLYRPCECRHYHKATVEDVLDEFVERWHDTHHDDIPALLAEYAAKLRLAGEDK